MKNSFGMMVVMALKLISTSAVAMDYSPDMRVEQATVDGLTEAVRRRNSATVRVFAGEGVDVNAHDSHGYTALGIAARQAIPEMVDLLIAAGADVNGVDRFGRMPLCQVDPFRLPVAKKPIGAAVQVIDKLLRMGSRPCLKAQVASQFIDMAVRKNMRDQAIVPVLRAVEDQSQFASRYLRRLTSDTRRRFPALQFRSAGGVLHALLPREALRPVLRAAAAQQDGDGFTMLMSIAGDSYMPDDQAVALMRALIAAGADVNARTAYGETALDQAIGMDRVRALLEASAEVDVQDSHHFAP